MAVKIELQFNNNVELKGQKFATLEIKDTQDQPLGRLVIGKVGLTYCRPGQWIRTGTRKSWEEVIEIFS